eukprot:15458523-Alexandrium_andersonii.AAC.1
MRSEGSGAPRCEAAQPLEGVVPNSCRRSSGRRAPCGGPGTADVALREAVSGAVGAAQQLCWDP